MTFLRWAGSKKKLLDTLSCCWYASNCMGSSEGRYIEGFSGSAALFFRLKPSKALLIDVNHELQHCMARVRNSPKSVSAALAKLGSSEENYYKIRALEKDNLSADEWAARFIYLNRYCFNGLYRTNKKGNFNVPFGGGRSGSLPTEVDLLEASQVLKKAKLLTGDFFEIILLEAGADDFIYLDPPYAKINSKLDNQYGPNVFGVSDIGRLFELTNAIDAKGAHFVVSYAACDEILPLAKRWNSFEVSVQRTIAANVAHRNMAKELLITNI